MIIHHLLIPFLLSQIPTLGTNQNGQFISATYAPLNLYVATTGNDSISCTSSATPCKTIQGAVNQVPKLIRNPVTINVAAGTYSAGAYIQGFSFDGEGSLSVSGTLAVASFTGTMSGTLTSATSDNNSAPATWGAATVANAGWTSNQLATSLLCITSGSDTGDCRVIQQNTSDVITIVGNWSYAAAPNSGDSFEIETWATSVTGVLPQPGGAVPGNSSQQASFYVNNCAIPAASGGPSASPLGFYAPKNTGWITPKIKISNFQFTPGDGNTAVSLGAGSLGFVNNSLPTNGFAITQIDGFLYADANYLMEDSAANNALISQYVGTGVGTAHASLVVRGNYAMLQNSASTDNALAGIFSLGTITQNYVTGIPWPAVGTENGIYIGRGNSSTYSIGNQYYNVAYGISHYAYWHAEALISGDSFVNCTNRVIDANNETIVLGPYPIVGSGNLLGLDIKYGGIVYVYSTPTMTSTTDIQFDDNTNFRYSWSTLRGSVHGTYSFLMYFGGGTAQTANYGQLIGDFSLTPGSLTASIPCYRATAQSLPGVYPTSSSGSCSCAASQPSSQPINVQTYCFPDGNGTVSVQVCTAGITETAIAGYYGCACTCH